MSRHDVIGFFDRCLGPGPKQDRWSTSVVFRLVEHVIGAVQHSISDVAETGLGPAARSEEWNARDH